MHPYMKYLPCVLAPVFFLISDSEFQNGGGFVRFVMSDYKDLSVDSEGCPDNLQLVQEVFGKGLVNCATLLLAENIT